MTELDNVDKLVLRIQKLLGYVKYLEKYRGVTAEELEADVEKRSIVERQLELACESCLDIARLVVTDQRLPIPEKTSGYILALGKGGIIDLKFAEEFAGMANFRNILVHMYLEIDYRRVVDNLNNHLGDFERFAREIAKYYEVNGTKG